MNHNVKEAANRVRMLRLKQCFTARENAEVTASMLADAETLADYVWELATSPNPAPAHVGDAGILVDALESIAAFSNATSPVYKRANMALNLYAASVPQAAPVAGEPHNSHCSVCGDAIEADDTTAMIHRRCAFKLEVGAIVKVVNEHVPAPTAGGEGG